MRRLLSLFFLFVFTACINENRPSSSNEQHGHGVKPEPKELVLYSHRHYDTDKEIFAAFEKETGIHVRVKEADARELINLLENEGDNSPADVFITSDAAGLHLAESKGLLSPLNNLAINQTVEPSYRQADGLWFALTLRARVVVYNPDRVKEADITYFSDLTDAKWKNRIAVRSSDNFYNQSLLAGIIAHEGEEKALAWARGMVKNMYRSPKGNDRDQIKEVAAGNADIAIVNSYYLGKMLESSNPAEVEAAKKVNIHFIPINPTAGVHMNVSGAGILKTSKNKEAAEKFIAYLLRKDVQEKFAAANFEYPVNKQAEWPQLLKDWGNFTPDSLNISELGRHNNKAIATFAQAGWK